MTPTPANLHPWGVDWFNRGDTKVLNRKTIFCLVYVLGLLNSSLLFGASSQDVVINELMWCGSTASLADEWIELRNMTNNSIDLSGWQITKNTATETPMLTIPAGKTIAANGYFLIANYDENSAKSSLDVISDLVTTTVSLSNSKLQIKLYDGPWDSGGNLIDTANDGNKPFVGDNTNKYSMERNSVPGDGTLPDNWHTALTSVGFDPGATEKGTPGSVNSAPPPPPPPPPAPTRTVKINEVMYDPEGADAEGEEWIELYNTGTEPVNLTGWTLGDEDGNWFIFPSFTLNPGAYVVIHYNATNTPADNTSTDLYTGVANQWTNTEDQVSLYNSSLHNETTIVDFVAYCSDGSYTNPNPDDDNAVGAGIWSSGAYIDTSGLGEGESLGLNSNGQDTDRTSDWRLFKNPSPGEANPSPMPEGTIIRINEVSFKEERSRDWIELYCVADGNGGAGVNIGNCYIKTGPSILKTIGAGTIIRTGEYLVLHQGILSDDTFSDEDGIIDIFVPDTALTSTDSQVIFYDQLDQMLDAVCWANRDETWSQTNANRVKELSEAGQWQIAGEEAQPEDCVDSTDVETGYSIARDTNSTDTNTKNDWHIDQTPSMGRNNAKGAPSTRISRLSLSNRCFLTDGSDPDRRNTTIFFTLAVESQVTIRIYDVQGRKIRTLIDDEELLYGENSVVWDGRDDEGRTVPIGIYICYLQAINSDSGGKDIKKITIVAAKQL